MTVLVGIACGIGGVINLANAAKDHRAAFLAQFQHAVLDWSYGDLPTFKSIGWALKDSQGYYQPLRGMASAVTSASFGETSLFSYPPSIQTYTYRDTVRCPGVTPNRTCAIELRDSGSGAPTVIRKVVMPAVQVGPTPHMKVSTLCQWYDGDWWHPMASVGFGECNNDVAGRGSPQTYNYGPNRCVLDHYLDERGCPNDVIPTTQLVQAGWGWATNLVNKKRFTYENGKCWDYTDCACTGCGLTFQTDTTKGWGFTGYGYFAAGTWHPFAKPFASMSANEKAKQCSAAFSSIGHTCPAAQVNLVCFRAGGYPKKKCSTFCEEQDSLTASYTPPRTYVQMSTLYGPWGEFQGHFPSYTNVPATCQWSRTRTERLTKLSIVTTADGTREVQSKWVSQNTTTQGSLPFLTPLPSYLNVDIEIQASTNPVLRGADITNGCNLHPNPSRCFGPSAGSLFRTGVVCLAVSGAMLLCCGGALAQRQRVARRHAIHLPGATMPINPTSASIGVVPVIPQQQPAPGPYQPGYQRFDQNSPPMGVPVG